jgi:hypothetical protein
MSTKDERRALHAKLQAEAEDRRAARRAAWEQRTEAEAAAHRAAHEARLAEARTKAPKERLRRRVLALSPWARLQGLWYVYPAGLVLFFVGTARLFGALDITDVYAPLLRYVALPAGVAFCGLLLWSLQAVQVDLARELAWRATLPFAVVDYDACLEDEPDASAGVVGLVLTFEGAAPPPEAVQAALPGWQPSPAAGEWFFRPGPSDSGASHTAALAKWFRRLAEGPLRELHARAPLKRVRVLDELWVDSTDD